MVKEPCKNCPKRKLGCHDTCRDYNEWKEERHKLVVARYYFLAGKKSTAAKRKMAIRAIKDCERR